MDLRDESGTTLPEVLVTVVILGVGFATLLVGLVTAAAGAQVHRDQADVETVLRSYAESIEAAAWIDCATGAPGYTFTPPSGFTATIVASGAQAPREWNLTTNAFEPCTPALASDVQLLTLEVTDTGRAGVSDTLTVAKRKP